jgi:hypothetical protein
VLHGSDADLPTPPVPSVRVTAIGTGPIAVPNLAGPSRTPIERSEAALTQTRLTLHTSNIRPPQNGLVNSHIQPALSTPGSPTPSNMQTAARTTAPSSSVDASIVPSKGTKSAYASVFGPEQFPAVDAGRMSVVPGEADAPGTDKLGVDDAQRLGR